MDTTQVGDAIRSARKRQRMSQRAYAEQLGINRARLARLEVDAGRQPLEVVAWVLAHSGFELTVRPIADGWDSDDPTGSTQDPRAGKSSLLDLFDAAGRRLPAHCDPYQLPRPHLLVVCPQRRLADPRNATDLVLRMPSSLNSTSTPVPERRPSGTVA